MNMKLFWQQVCGPLNSIRAQPYQFAVWWVVANIFGLAGFLLPLFLGWMLSKDSYLVFLAAVRSGSLAAFSIVLLAEGIASALVAEGAGSNLVAAGLRGLVSVFALLVAGVQVVFLVVQGMTTDGSTPAPVAQVVLTGTAILVASYLYCFRFASWEKGVGAQVETENKELKSLVDSAKKLTHDDTGVSL
ncbi:MAG TPA: hypothetical protein VMI32_18710 [Candidatus Solibacter sp.]|nr:hypothetical protein [Candidatus Solibacter sp.]